MKIGLKRKTKMTKIKDASIIVLIVFIILSVLYGIHMFRYEFIKDQLTYGVIRYDRITNTHCYSALPTETIRKQVDYLDMKLHNDDGTFNVHVIRKCNNPTGKALFGAPTFE